MTATSKGKGVFQPVPAKVDFVANEERVLKWWDDAGIVQKYLHRNDASPRRYSFIDGPITATNHMAVHHAWGRTYKDLFLRWRNMQGYRQRFQNGFDGQGLWVEVEVEKDKGFKSKRDIEAYGIARFVEECKARVRHYAGVMSEESKRLGYFMDWDDSYHTMSDENNYTIWHFLKTCHERGWLYEGTDVMPWCPRCGTGLSQHEIVTEGYKELTHSSVYVKLPLLDRPGESLVVWTTTPWTLPANVAAAVNPNHTYVKVKTSPGPSSALSDKLRTASGTGEILWLGALRAPKVLKGEYEILEQRKGRELLGWRFSGPFDELPVAEIEWGKSGSVKDAHRIIEWDEVGEEEGTGIVHIAPGAGAEDFQLGKREKLPVIAPLDESGVFLTSTAAAFMVDPIHLVAQMGDKPAHVAGPESPPFPKGQDPDATAFGALAGKPVAQVNELVVESLRQKGVFYKIEKITHRYPVCWRCNTELVFRLVSEWFINMDGEGFIGPDGRWLSAAESAKAAPGTARRATYRGQMVEVTKRIRWEPSFGLERELDWLRNMQDWMISKKRYWGLALPIWKCGKCGGVDVIGSEHELEQRAVEGWSEFDGHSPHRPWVDAVKIACPKCAAKMSRIKDVGNPWLDAGIVPFSTLNYRHDKSYWKDWYPADWISESFPGQFRNWFYSLLAMSTALENREPTRAVFSYALMFDEKGEEMHKSKGNAIWFNDGAKKMGVDVMRWQFARQNPSLSINFGYGPGDEVRRQFLIPLWNVYSFFVTYANLDGWRPASLSSPWEGEDQGEGRSPSRREHKPSTHTPALSLPGRGGNALALTELDRWALSELHTLTSTVTRHLEEWRPEAAAREIEEFVDRLSNWYVRRSRRRFWKSEGGPSTGSGPGPDKAAAYATLHECLTTLTRLLAPFVPFVSEEMYQNLVAGRIPGAPESVHLTDWPRPDASLIDEDLSARTQLAIRLASLGRSARASAKIKVRQPLAELVIELREEKEQAYLAVIEPQLLDELNVKRVRAIEWSPSASVGQGGLMSFSVKPNLPKLGPKYGRQLSEIRALLSKANAAEVAAAAVRGQTIKLAGFELAPDEVLVEKTAPAGYAVAAEGGYAAGVTTEITPELKAEGTAREVVHLIQNLRKSAGLEIADRISLFIEASGPVRAALESLGGYVREETLATSVTFSAPPSGTASESHDVEGERVTVGLKKA
jgi:isoleucyl-tRNA synthetase